MNGYELISPKTGEPCGVFACGVCNLVTTADLSEKCCKPCDCGKPSRNRFECKCSSCADVEYKERRAKQLEKAELVEWDGSMIFSEEVSGYRDGWFNSPDDLLDYLADEEEDNIPEFEQMTEDTYEDAELHVGDADWRALLAAVDAFNAKYAVTYYEYDYKRKVRVSAKDSV